ncbi:BaiN/RdsA family NAD(P)/FAD-dependent oxidoreductase [Chryseobacterium sp. A321]
MNEKHIVIIGAGPAGLMAAYQLALQGKKVHVYEQNKAAARKFLVAGKGGFNLTHSEPIDTFVTQYDRLEMQEIVKDFDNDQVTQWLGEIGISTYVGSSGKIFPTKNFKPIEVLNAWLEKLSSLGVQIHYEHRFVSFENSKVYLENKGKQTIVEFSHLVLALGGGSWKKTGSNAQWISFLKEKKIEIIPLESANSGYETKATFHTLQGQYLKNTKVSFESTSKIGELVFTKYGIEGSSIYYMNRFTRHREFPLVLTLDLKPSVSESEILNLLKEAPKMSPILKRELKLSTTALNLLKTLDKTSYLDPVILTKHIKSFPVEVLGYRPIDEVISTSGGVAFSSLAPTLELKECASVYCAGEMLDWEAPTGGYLLQGCFSSGARVAKSILANAKSKTQDLP